MKPLIGLGVVAAALIANAAAGNVSDAPAPTAMVEIFKLAPGKQEAFIRNLAEWDQVAAAGGQPPAQMYLHNGGDEWDVMVLKPFPRTPVTKEQQAAMDAKAEQMHLKAGPALFLDNLQDIASRKQSRVLGPMAASQWLAQLDTWRATHPEAARGD